MKYKRRILYRYYSVIHKNMSIRRRVCRSLSLSSGGKLHQSRNDKFLLAQSAVKPYENCTTIIHSTAAGCVQIFTKNVHILIPDFIPTAAPAPLPVPAVKTTTSPPLLQTQQLIQSFIPDLNPVHFSTIPLNPL